MSCDGWLHSGTMECLGALLWSLRHWIPEQGQACPHSKSWVHKVPAWRWSWAFQQAGVQHPALRRWWDLHCSRRVILASWPCSRRVIFASWTKTLSRIFMIIWVWNVCFVFLCCLMLLFVEGSKRFVQATSLFIFKQGLKLAVHCLSLSSCPYSAIIMN